MVHDFNIFASAYDVLLDYLVYFTRPVQALVSELVIQERVVSRGKDVSTILSAIIQYTILCVTTWFVCKVGKKSSKH